ncbi:MAG: AAA family ATPase, partial [Desulfobacteraceae bacterium]|nr:AAA family ATPase [Desulfobacteraceae bacterium]
MRIKELHIENFRCFKELDIKFPDSNSFVFAGINGSGKTAILDCIAMLLTHFSQKICRQSHQDTDLSLSEDDISITAPFSLNK